MIVVGSARDQLADVRSADLNILRFGTALSDTLRRSRTGPNLEELSRKPESTENSKLFLNDLRNQKDPKGSFFLLTHSYSRLVLKRGIYLIF